MKIGIMQPYLFPYIGYFQLISEVDKFIIYDDVNFIKQGWINRNSILNNEKSIFFVLPLENQSSFKKINETNINVNFFEIWKKKFLKTIYQNYSKAPFFKTIYLILEDCLIFDNGSISNLNFQILKKIINYLQIDTKIIESSLIYKNNHLNASERIIDICNQEKASNYVNLLGGINLYDKSNFFLKDIDLNFIKSKEIIYKQFKNNFVSNLSIIDVLMFNDVEKIKFFLKEIELT